MAIALEIKEEDSGLVAVSGENLHFNCGIARLDLVNQIPENEGVYLLVDDLRHAYYVGESEEQGLKRRIETHSRGWSWWNRVVFFYRPSGGFFDNGKKRRYLEHQIFSLLRGCSKVIALMTKSASAPSGYCPTQTDDDYFSDVKAVCRILGLLPFCVAEPDDLLRRGVSVSVVEGEVCSTDPLPPPPPPLQKHRGGNFWASKVANSVGLSKAPGGLASHVSGTWQLPDNSKWRPVFMALGLYRDDGTLKSMDEFPPELPVLPADVLDEFHRHDRRATRIAHAQR